MIENDLLALVQMACETNDSLQCAEFLSLLTALSFAHPDEVHPCLSRAGGATLFVSILQRHSHHVHVQVSALHLLSAILKGLPTDMKPDVERSLNAIFVGIQDILAPYPALARHVSSFDGTCAVVAAWRNGREERC